MHWLILLLGAVVALVIARPLLQRAAARLWPRQPADEAAPSQATTPPVPVAEPPGAPASPHELAQALQPFYDSSSHPLDLLDAEQFRAGVELLCDPRYPMAQLIDYTLGANQPLATMAAEAIAMRDDGATATEALLPYLSQANVWTACFILRALQRHMREPVVARVLMHGADWWPGNPTMPRIVSQFVTARLEAGERVELGALLANSADVNLSELKERIKCLQLPLAATLAQELANWERNRIDVQYLSTVGHVWPSEVNDPAPIEHERVRAGIEAGMQALSRVPPASLLVVGEAGVGKSTLIRALGRRLQGSGWTIFEASAVELLAGQVYIGELEQRVRELLMHLHSAKRVVWYIPNFHELFHAGRHRYSPAGALDMIMPALESGALCVIGELQVQALEKVAQQRPRVRSAFRTLMLEPLSREETLRLAAAVVERDFRPHGIDADAGTLREGIELARHHLSDRAQPGNLLDLLHEARAALLQRPAAQRKLTRAELLATLTRRTGLPTSVLDDRAGLEPSRLRAFFLERVMGQPEAVDCLVDRIAMLKAGLTDPARPIGVFLFAGPTGTGKTEAAKTLAEFLFGSAERMIRLDMSELQESSALERVIGDSGESSEVNALTNRIRRQPFSVILLDEFEKAHARIWDLFLQVFDDGHLTDALGNRADFRHSIIILTSNLGGTEHHASSLGFVPGGDAFGEAQVMRAINKTFRPEFVNRIDRVIVFRPLAKSVMREILKKELRALAQRRGFRNREWAIEWEDSAIEFLLAKGFTKNMGARPLRRAIDQYVLAPIAKTIVEHRFPEGDQFLFVRAAVSALEVEFVDPDAPGAAPDTAPVGAPERPAAALAEILLAPRGAALERETLTAELARLTLRLDSAAWAEAKENSLRAMRAPEFWNDPRRHGVLQKIETMDAIEAAANTAQSLARRLSARSGSGSAPPVIVATLAQQLYLVHAALRDLDAGLSSDAFLSVEPVALDGRRAHSHPDWPRRLADMYLAWGRKRHIRVQALPADHADLWIAAIGGVGAHDILSRETGLHVLEVPGTDGGFDRVAARVRVVPQPAAPPARRTAEREHALACLNALPAENRVVRRYRAQPSPLVRDAQDGWRSGRLDLVLGGDFDLMHPRG